MDEPHLSNATLVARILAGAWRASPPPCDLTPDQIAQVTPLLSSSGGTGLGWWRVKETPLAPDAVALRGSAQLLALEEVVNQAALSELCALLNGVGITPLLFKGWVAARSYPQGWMRPYGDFDLLVRGEEFAKARAVLAAAATRFRGNDFALPFGPRGHCAVDLHDRLDLFYAADVATLFARAVPVILPGGTLLVPSPEDHLRLCAIHMFRHGGWRPLWLCDIAAMSEASDTDFDWDICLSNRPASAAWTATAVMLAHRLLGARIEHLPPRVRNQCVPDWLEAAVLMHWQNPRAERVMPPGSGSILHPIETLRRHWPNPITATIGCGGLPLSGPRLHWQIMRLFMSIGRGVKLRFRQS